MDDIHWLCAQLTEARTRHETLHDQLDTPPEPGTAEFEEATRLLAEIDELLTKLGQQSPETARGAEAMAVAVLAHSGDLRPSICEMIKRIYEFLRALP